MADLSRLPGMWRRQAGDFTNAGRHVQASLLLDVANELELALHDDRHDGEWQRGCYWCDEERKENDGEALDGQVTDTTSLGDRMKRYENVTRYYLPRRTYTIIRVDGRAFHSLLSDAAKPFDFMFIDSMAQVAHDLCVDITGAVFAYAQSDEVSILVTDFRSIHSEPWFGANIQKMASSSAAMATRSFNENWPRRSGTFDSRVFTIPDPAEVANYFLWRQRDAVRNSISMAAQALFRHRDLQNLNSSQLQEKMWAEKGVNWNDFPASARRGTLVYRKTAPMPFSYTHSGTQETFHAIAERSWWHSEDAPRFEMAELLKYIPRLEPG